ncbi:MAG: hypothetical protein DRP42_07010, partial [Tenericutes bacterium]
MLYGDDGRNLGRNILIRADMCSHVQLYHGSFLRYNRFGGDQNMAKISNKKSNFIGWGPTDVYRNFWLDMWDNYTLVRRLNLVIFCILFGLHIFDVWSTLVFIEHGGGESNPIVLWYMDTLGV